jgi:hypothetical protein
MYHIKGERIMINQENLHSQKRIDRWPVLLFCFGMQTAVIALLSLPYLDTLADNNSNAATNYNVGRHAYTTTSASNTDAATHCHAHPLANTGNNSIEPHSRANGRTNFTH